MTPRCFSFCAANPRKADLCVLKMKKAARKGRQNSRRMRRAERARASAFFTTCVPGTTT